MTAVSFVDQAVEGETRVACRLLGHAAAEVLGRPAADLLADGAAPPLVSGPRWEGTVGLRHRDRRTVSVWLLAHHRPPHDNRPTDWLVVTPLQGGGPDPADDQIDTVALTQSPCPVAIFDERLRLRRMNGAMAEVLGLTEERARGLRISEIGGKPQNETVERELLRVLSTGRPRDVQTYSRSGGEERAHAWLALMAPVLDTKGRVHGVSLAAHDFTENCLARERLQLVNEASVRIGSTLDVTRTAQELADVCVPALADFVRVDLLDAEEQRGTPEARLTAPVVLRRAAHRSVLSGAPEVLIQPGGLGT